MKDGLLKLKDFPAEIGGSGKHFPSSTSSRGFAVSAQLVNANRRVSAADRNRNRGFDAVEFTDCFLHRF